MQKPYVLVRSGELLSFRFLSSELSQVDQLAYLTEFDWHKIFLIFSL